MTIRFGHVAVALADNASSDPDRGFAWPVAIIGGLIVLAGLYALRGEFDNWRQRRDERKD